MKKISVLLVFLLIFSVMSSTVFAASGLDNEYVVNYAIQQIKKVNNLSKEEAELLEKDIRNKVSSMSIEEKRELYEGMKNLENDFMEQQAQQEKNPDNIIMKDMLYTPLAEEDYLIMLIYVGNDLAPLSGYMLICDEAGYEVIKDIVKIGGGAGAIGTALAALAGVAIAAPIAAIIGGYVAIQMGLLSLQFSLGNEQASIVI